MKNGVLNHNKDEENYVSFYERKAFVDDVRRKWKEDQGLVSLFDKRQKYKIANQKTH